MDGSMADIKRPRTANLMGFLSNKNNRDSVYVKSGDDKPVKVEPAQPLIISNH